jgi:hypothetical protein
VQELPEDGAKCYNEKMIEYNPEKNPKAISIIEEEDGNFRGYTQKFGKLVSVRAGKPEDVLVGLITHDGQ